MKKETAPFTPEQIREVSKRTKVTESQVLNVLEEARAMRQKRVAGMITFDDLPDYPTMQNPERNRAR